MKVENCPDADMRNCLEKKINKYTYALVTRRVSDKLDVFEEFIRLYQEPSIDAATLATVSKETFISKLQGQCYDRASSMNGALSGVVQRIMTRALIIHPLLCPLNKSSNM